MNRRRSFIRTLTTIAVVSLYAPAMLVTGCFDSSDVASLMQTLGGACATLAGILGNSSLAAKITELTAAAVQAVANWKSGTPTEMAIEAINALEAAIGMISGINPAVAVLIMLALGTADAILLLLPPAAVTPGVMAKVQARKRVKINAPPKSKAGFKVQWNAVIDDSSDPLLLGAKL